MSSTLNKIVYKINVPISEEEIIEVFESSGITRPVQDKGRIKTMFQNSDVIISAWSSKELVGVSRALTDYAYCCYLSDLAVKKNYQGKGIGRRMIEITKETIGDKVMLLLLSAPSAINYYCKIGLEKAENGFMIKRKF